MESVARIGGLPIIKRLEGDSVSVTPPSPPFSVQVAQMMAAIPMHAIGPEQINARKAALMREETKSSPATWPTSLTTGPARPPKRVPRRRS
jgi:hypothetical protein